MLKVQEKLHDAVRTGLQSKERTNVQCFPTYVTGLPDGSEKGLYLVIDFGAPHLRIIGADIDVE